MTRIEDHKWPKDKAAHVWGEWRTFDSRQKYRLCVHPDCRGVEYKVVE